MKTWVDFTLDHMKYIRISMKKWRNLRNFLLLLLLREIPQY